MRLILTRPECQKFPWGSDALKQDRIGTSLLMSLGILTVGMGVYFAFFRPAMLPEDIRFTGVQPQLLQPRMAEWLGVVFRTWGAFMLGFGILLMALAFYLFTKRPIFLRTGVVASILVAFTRLLVSNVVLRSDYLWFVGVLFGIAAVTALHSSIYANYPSLRK